MGHPHDINNFYRPTSGYPTPKTWSYIEWSQLLNHSKKKKNSYFLRLGWFSRRLDYLIITHLFDGRMIERSGLSGICTHQIEQMAYTPNYCVYIVVEMDHCTLITKWFVMNLITRVKGNYQVLSTQVQGCWQWSPATRKPAGIGIGERMDGSGGPPIQRSDVGPHLSVHRQPKVWATSGWAGDWDQHWEAWKGFGCVRGKAFQDQIPGRGLLYHGRFTPFSVYSLLHDNSKGISYNFTRTCECMVGGHFCKAFYNEDQGRS